MLLTCSSLGPAVGLARAGVPIRRADAALAARVARESGPVLVLCAAPSTLEATGALFAAPNVTLRLVPGAWALFRAGQAAAYHAAIAEAAEAAGGTVALAQVSMAPAAALCRRARVLTVPQAALAALLRD